jgi:hypothetical protein
MTGPEHYREAERLIAEARTTAQASTLESTHRYAQTIAEAQVHATRRSRLLPQLE